MSAGNDTRNSPGMKVGVVARLDGIAGGGAITPCTCGGCTEILFPADAVTGLSDLRVGHQVFYEEAFPYPEVNARQATMVRTYASPLPE
ncbi:MAG: hypothetical protein HQ530_01115 [Parcubacteria group bacterium]|nr:hypothetical protein [Parcubacteria group bacterium]